MGGDPDRDPRRAKRLDLLEVRGDAGLAHAVEPAALVGDVEQHDRDARCRCRLGGRERLCGAEVVELAHGRVAGCPHLEVDVRVVTSDRVGRRAIGLLEHPVAPRPEVGPGSPAAQRALERVAVAVDEAGQGDRSGHEPTTLPPRRLGLRDDGAPDRLRPRAPDPERADADPLRGDPGLHLAAARGPDRAELAGGDRVRPCGDHRPARRLSRPALARRVAVRQGGRPARRQADDRHGRRHARRLRPVAVGRPRSSSFAICCSSAATSSSCPAATTSRYRGSGRSPPGASTPRSASCSSRRRAPGGRSRCFWISLALAVIAAGQYVAQGAAHRPSLTGAVTAADGVDVAGRESARRGEIVSGHCKAST